MSDGKKMEKGATLEAYVDKFKKRGNQVDQGVLPRGGRAKTGFTIFLEKIKEK